MTFGFGAFELDTDRLELRHHGGVVPLEPQAFDVLVHLVTHRGRVVPKEELMDEVWGGRFVSEAAVTSRIKQARRALGDDGQAQVFIRTYHGRGYRFLPDVQVVPEPALTASAAAAPAAGPDAAPLLSVEVTGTRVAYHLAGQGPPDIVLLRTGADLAADWDHPDRGRLVRGLARMGRLIRLELPGAGGHAATDALDLETRLRLLLAVLDDAASERAILLAESDAGPWALTAAAGRPDRVSALVLHGTSAVLPVTPAPATAPATALDDASGGSPGVDVRALLPSVGQPTLVLHRTDDPEVPVGWGRMLAARIPTAEFVELDAAPDGTAEQVLDAIEALVEDEAAREAPTQSLSALVGLAGEDVDALTEVLVTLGGRVRRGPEHALVVSFDGPATAIRALASRRARGLLRGVGVGLAIDEVSRDSRFVSGHGVDVARLMARRAAPGEVLVPTVVKDLLAGSGLRVESVGRLDLPHVGPHPAYRWLRT